MTIRFEADLRGVPGVAKVAEKLANRSASEIDAVLDSYAAEVS